MSQTHTARALTAGISPAAPAKFVRRCCGFYLCALVGFWIISVGFVYARLYWRHAEFSLNSLTFKDGIDRFCDMTNFDPATGRFVWMTVADPITNLPVREAVAPAIPYPPASEGVFILFAKLFSQPLYPYLLIFSSSVIIAAGLLIRALLASAVENRWLLVGVVAVSATLSFPITFLIERANFEGFVWLMSLIGLTAFVTRYYKAAAVLFALAAAMKIYPGVLLLLFVSRKRYKELALAIVAFAFFWLAGLQLLGPSIPAAFQEIRTGTANVGAFLLAYDYEAIRYDHSLFSVIRQCLYFYYANQDDAGLTRAVTVAFRFYILLAVCGFAWLYWFKIRKMPLLNQLAALIILSITLPFMSQEYTLTHTYFPFALFLLFLARDVASGRASISPKSALVILGCFAFVFAMGPFGIIAGQLKAIALMLLLAMMLTVPMRASFLNDPPA